MNQRERAGGAGPPVIVLLKMSGETGPFSPRLGGPPALRRPPEPPLAGNCSNRCGRAARPCLAIGPRAAGITKVLQAISADAYPLVALEITNQ
jgi:hypothetical protein